MCSSNNTPEFKTRLNIFLAEARRLTSNSYFKDRYMNLDLVIKSKYIYIENHHSLSNIKKYTYARIDPSTGDIYSQSGKEPQGNLFDKRSGIDCIDMFGVIVNDHKRKRRENEIEHEEEKKIRKSKKVLDLYLIPVLNNIVILYL